jgi:hypothetical protein
VRTVAEGVAGLFKNKKLEDLKKQKEVMQKKLDDLKKQKDTFAKKLEDMKALEKKINELEEEIKKCQKKPAKQVPLEDLEPLAKTSQTDSTRKNLQSDTLKPKMDSLIAQKTDSLITQAKDTNQIQNTNQTQDTSKKEKTPPKDTKSEKSSKANLKKDEKPVFASKIDSLEYEKNKLMRQVNNANQTNTAENRKSKSIEQLKEEKELLQQGVKMNEPKQQPKNKDKDKKSNN